MKGKLPNHNNRLIALDGLRGVAIGLVVAFHTGFLPGGYLGVDMFFVISGFILGRKVEASLLEGDFSFPKFVMDRFRRLIPGQILVVLVVLIAGWWLLLPSQYAILGRHAAAAQLLMPNLSIAMSSGYFAEHSRQEPLLHLWSLGVEWQFYLLLVPLLVLIYRFKFRWRCSLLNLICIGSLATYLLLPIYYPSESYFLPINRAWQFCSGWYLASFRMLSYNRWLTVVAWAVMAILVSLSKPLLFGMSSIATVMATLVIINNSTLCVTSAKFLNFCLLRKTGEMSYGIYLWHYPILAFAYARLINVGPFAISVCVVASFIMAWISFRWAEPFLREIIWSKPEKKITKFLLTMLTVFVLGLLILIGNGLPFRWSDKVQSIDATAHAPVTYLKCPQYWANDLLCNSDGAEKGDVVLILGDSHAIRIFGALAEEVKAKGDIPMLLAKPGCPPIIGLTSYIQGYPYLSCKKYQEQISKAIQSGEISKLVLVARWGAYLNRVQLKEFEEQLKNTIKLASKAGIHVTLIGPVPEMPFDAPACLARVAAGQWGITECFARNSDKNQMVSLLEVWLENAQYCWVDSYPPFCDSKFCSAEINDEPAFIDRDHLSKKGAIHLAKHGEFSACLY